MRGQLQVVLDASEGFPLVAGLPSSVRAARASGEALRAAKVVVLSDPEAFTARWGSRLCELPWASAPAGDPRALKELLSPRGAVLALAGGCAPDAAALKAFVDAAERSASPSLLVAHGQTLAAYHPDAGRLREALPDAASWDPARLLSAEGALRVEVDGGWPLARDAASARALEDRLFAALPQSTDGYIARFDRTFSMALSRRLLPLPVTPNAVTTFSLLLGLLGAALLVSLSYPLQVFGAVLLWSCCILDGCDGEIARLKLMCSRAGGLYDVWADNIVHAAIFVALPLHVARIHPETDFRFSGALLLSGFLLSAFWVWRLVLSRPKSERGELGLIVERVASRDFIYIILLLTVLRRLEWFVWTAAIGSHLFWLALLGARSLERRRAPAAS
ncbi:MAG: CDP-alcohol phosphatidyltransferase family protein [Elusimicrobiota bacterium]|jgi:phosphatidylglycerophosphate synthase